MVDNKFIIAYSLGKITRKEGLSMNLSTRNMTIIALMVAIVSVSSQLVLPIGPVPISLQTLAVALVGNLLLPGHALLVCLLYLFLGLVGLPVFAGGSGGIGSLVNPSFGFILSFILAAPLLSLMVNHRREAVNFSWGIAYFFFHLLIYGLGLPYMAFILNGLQANHLPVLQLLQIGLVPFIPGDIIKSILAIIICKRIQKNTVYQKYFQQK